MAWLTKNTVNWKTKNTGSWKTAGLLGWWVKLKAAIWDDLVCKWDDLVFAWDAKSSQELWNTPAVGSWYHKN